MSLFPHSCRLGKPALAAVLGAALLAGPAVPALAQSNTMASRVPSAASREESVDQRIATLHSELKITPAEETDWQAVAQTMRDNAAAMEQMASEKASQQDMTAVDDLHTYARFAEAHVEHLKKLTAAFETLYSAMPEQQKKLADQVFAQSRHQEGGGQG